jgi:hypothetical protein
MAKLRETLSLRNPATQRTLLVGLAFVAGFIVLGIISIQVWEYSNSVAFCSDTCHNVHPEEPAAFQDSYHARVKCTECHMGRTGTLQGILLKAGHFRHLPEVLTGNYGRPTESESLRPPNESCERCHWPPAFHGDTVREVIGYEPVEENTEKRTYLILRTGGGERERGLGQGIHWHIANPVEFIAAGEEKQEIPWIRSTLPDGRTVEYNDVTDPLSADEIADGEPKLMDCVDCHNRVGHPFSSPDKATDEAITEGRLSRDLPFAKQEMVELLSADYVDQAAALEEVGDVKDRYVSEYPEAAAAYPGEIEQAAQTAQELIKRLIFATPGVTWESFPDNSGHKEFAGCFRCHDGNHVNEEGESIRLHCNICHSIPVTVGEGDRPPDKPVVSLQEPDSHLAANFMADHRFQASDDCVQCHGEIEFGSDDSSFCANSACHGQAWPEVELDAAFEHPIELLGKHAETWCHECHEGVEKPEYKCANCHEPPSVPHFGEQCEDCHTPLGFEQADMGDFEHPVPLVGNHAALDCLACHSAGFDLTYECAACHEPPSEPHFGQQCEDCHTPEGFEQADTSGFQHPVALEGNHATLDCMACHSAGFDLTYECAACHKPPSEPHFGEQCEDCHTPEGFEQVEAEAVEHPVALIGKHATLDCMACHSEGFDLTYDCAACHQPPSEPHFGEQCEDCHTPEGFEQVDATAIQHPVPLEANHATLDCMACHSAGFDLTFDCAECHEPPENHFEAGCEACHNPEGWVESVTSALGEVPEIPHPTEGMDDCLVCHDPDEGSVKAPASHKAYSVEQCTFCHRPES